MITRKELIKKYMEFFKSKDHEEIPNSSLIPENDPTVLFTTAGMHPLVPFLLGQKHPLGKRLVGVQRCIRTGDIDCVGDEVHHTFFEMLGNWSLGDYWKKEAIEYSFEFLTKNLKIPKEKLSITCFKGENKIPKDSEAAEIWKSVGIEDKKIKFLGKKDNWWEIEGAGPCGPDTEMFVNNVEIWNDVFMQYEKDSKGNYNEAKQKNIDTGMGVERTLAILNNLEDNYLTDSFKPIIEKIEEMSGRDYGKEESVTKSMRIIADHIKAATFIMSEEIMPSNKERGYVLRKLIRRAVVHGEKLGLLDFTNNLSKTIFKIYPEYFPKKGKTFFVNRNVQQFILDEMGREEMGFRLTLDKGLKIFQDMVRYKKEISGKDAFLLAQSYGFPIELLKDLAKERKINIDEKGFQKELAKHQELSRTASAGKFKSGLADDSQVTTRLHTATHLLLAALKKILKDNSIIQKGSNINPERARFDFSFPRKLTPKEIQAVEDEVNSQIKKNQKVIREEMSPEQAKKSGATGIFDSKYGNKVSVYTIGNSSKEICTGPHVKNTKEIGKFKIKKEESSSAGVRRIKAILE